MPVRERERVRDASALAARWGLFPARLDPPIHRVTDVVREDLLALLSLEPTHLVSVIAPSGYGKTTLLTHHVATDPRSTAWVTVYEDCNDRLKLQRYLAAALARITPLPEPLTKELDVGRPRFGMIDSGLAALIRQGPPFSLVLDDVHMLSDRRCIDLLASLIDEVPDGSQIVLAARHETSFPLARARARGDLLELGVRHLRFSVPHAGALLRNAGALTVTDEEVASLTERTEGWPVGLYLAAKAISEEGPLDDPMAFGGDDRNVVDYLREAMLSDLPEDQVDFLVRTSVLDVLTGPLCDAALATTGSGALLQALEASNLLVVPLDHRRERYRYHHLMREMLQSELSARSPELIGPITSRASEWYEQAGSIDGAMQYAMAGTHVDRVGELIGRYAHATYYSGHAGSVRGWLAWLDAHGRIQRYPRAVVLGTWFLMLNGHPVEAERWADAAAEAEGSEPMEDEMIGYRMLASAWMCRSGPEQMLADAEAGAATIPPWSLLRCSALDTVGGALSTLGRVDEAASWFEEAAAVGTDREIYPGLAFALTELAAIELGRGDVGAAARRIAGARRAVEEGNLTGYFVNVLVSAISARVRLVQGDPVRARRDLQDAVSVAPGLTYAVPTMAVEASVALARCAMGIGDAALAESFLADAEVVLLHRPALGVLVDEVVQARTQLDELIASGQGVPALTPAEARLLPLLKTNLSFREMGAQLFVSPHTVKTQAISIYRKLGVTSRGEAVEACRRIGLLTP